MTTTMRTVENGRDLLDLLGSLLHPMEAIRSATGSNRGDIAVPLPKSVIFLHHLIYAKLTRSEITQQNQSSGYAHIYDEVLAGMYPVKRS